MHVGDWLQWAAIMLLPTLVVALAIHAVPWARAVRRRLVSRTADAVVEPIGAPIEQLAVDLRRLLHRHAAVLSTVDLPMRSQRLRAIEGALGDCAIEAAVALGLCTPGQPAPRQMSRPRLRRLLDSIVAEGLVLPLIGVLASAA